MTPDDPLPPLDASHWAPYIDTSGEQPASILVDLALREHAPDATRPFLLRLGLPLRDIQPDGLPTPDELRRVGEMEDVLAATLAEPLGARHVGSVTAAGRRDCLCYARVIDDLERWLAAFAQHFPDAGLEPYAGLDPEWEMYREVLFPSYPQLLCIRNRKLLDALAQDGDDPAEPRAVDHYAYFPTPEARGRYIGRLPELDQFLTIAQRIDGAEAPRPFGVRLTGRHAVALEITDPLVVRLAVFAAECGGLYDGWGCASDTR